MLLIELNAAKQYAAALAVAAAAAAAGQTPSGHPIPYPTATNTGGFGVRDGGSGVVSPGIPTPAPRARSFRGSIDVNATLAKSKLNTVAEEIVALLVSDPNAKVRVTVEIDAEFADGVKDNTKRAVSENADNLGFKTKDWE